MDVRNDRHLLLIDAALDAFHALDEGAAAALKRGRLGDIRDTVAGFLETAAVRSRARWRLPRLIEVRNPACAAR